MVCFSIKIFRKGFAVAMAVNETSVSASSAKRGRCDKEVKWSYKNKVTNRKKNPPPFFWGGFFFFFFFVAFHMNF